GPPPRPPHPVLGAKSISHGRGACARGGAPRPRPPREHSPQDLIPRLCGSSSAAGVHLEVRILLQRVQRNQRRLTVETEALFGASIGSERPDGSDQLAQFLSRRAGAERTTEVGAGGGIEAEEPDAIGGEAGPIAGRAERGGRRG